MRYEIVELQPLKVGAVTSLPASLARTSKWAVERDFITDTLVARLTALVYGQTKTARSTLTVRVPATWWQHFKADAILWGNPFFDPAKVRYRDVTVQVKDEDMVWWPEANPPVPASFGEPMRFVVSAEHQTVAKP